MESVQDNPALNKVFGLFQDFQKTGQFSRLFLETRGGAFTAHLSVQCLPHWPPWMERTRPAETRKPRRTTPSRRKRNQARREEWLARKQAKTKDIVIEETTLNQTEDTPILENKTNEVSNTVNKSTESVGSTDLTSKDLKVVPEGKSTKLVEIVSESKIQKLGVIEQIDGQVESSELYGAHEHSENPVDEIENKESEFAVFSRLCRESLPTEIYERDKQR